MRSVKCKGDQSNLTFAEFAYYWSENIIINYLVNEVLVENQAGNSLEKRLKIMVFVTSSEEVIRKFNDDKLISIKYVAQMKKKKKHAPISFYHSTYERISKFVKEMYSSDKLIENFYKLSNAFKREKYLQRYFYDNDNTFMQCKKVIVGEFKFFRAMNNSQG